MTPMKPEAAVAFLRRTAKGAPGLEFAAAPDAATEPPVTHFETLKDSDKKAAEAPSTSSTNPKQ